MDKVNFEEEYGSLPANVQAEARKEIIEACEWQSRTTFYNKMKGERGIRNWEMREIKAVFAKHDIVVFKDLK